ncbi:N-carbamoylsarcosine amidohydrolase [Pseudonocardia eucalypti]|uniref:N-carbamoylsarcosine amidohydrolase n=1 Tax=Pseudonocardia eucalypti TaxID=648755 RepID=A0ABP9QK14_9PSEU
MDFQTGFTDPASGVGAEMPKELAATAELIELCTRFDVPVMFTAVAFQPFDQSKWLRKMPGLHALREGGRWCQLDARLPLCPDAPVWIKRAPSAFFGTPLQPHLRALGIDTLIVTGSVTSGCILATVIDAASLGYHVIVPLECVTDRSPVAHLANLVDIDTKYGDVVELDEVTSHLIEAAASGNRVRPAHASR